MNDTRNDRPPVDQPPLVTSQTARPPSAEEDAPLEPIDLEIVASTYRAIVDQEAFEEMIANWNTKLESMGQTGTARRGISRQLFGQLQLAHKALETLDLPAENDPLKKAILDVPGPAIVLSPNGRVAMANIAGAGAFDAQDGAFFDPEVIDPRSRQDYAMLCRAANGQGNAAQTVLTITPAGKPGLSTDPFLAEGYLIKVRGQSDYYIALRSLEIDWSPTVGPRLRQAFGLSQAEAEVAQMFFRLRDLDAVARARGVSVLTVRTQMKSLMGKTGAPSNVDLMRLLSMIASREVVGRRGESQVWHDPLGREEQIVLPGGRVVAWTWMGAEDGAPAVLLRGFPMAYILPGEGEARLRAAGVKLYALSRPGFGNSTIDNGLSPSEDNLAALRAFLDHKVDGPCVGIGMSNGFVPLLEEQHANPSRFSSLIAIGYTGVLDRSGIHRLQLIQGTMMRLVVRAPWLVELMAKAGHRMMRQYGVDWYLDRAYRSRPLDMQSCRHPNMVTLIRNACEHLLKQGHAAFVRDLQLAVAPVDRMIDDLTVPLQFLAPTEDGVFDERAYRKLETRNPLIRVEPVTEAGELIFYQRNELILDRIIEAVQRGRGASPAV